MLSFLFGNKKRKDVPITEDLIPKEELIRIKELFNKYVKGNKYLNKDSYKEMLKEVCEINKNEWPILFDLLDGNGNGKIDFNEFIYWWTNPEFDRKETPLYRSSVEIRNLLSEKYNIFFGFSFTEWRNADKLNISKALEWSPDEVALFIATHHDLSVY